MNHRARAPIRLSFSRRRALGRRAPNTRVLLRRNFARSCATIAPETTKNHQGATSARRSLSRAGADASDLRPLGILSDVHVAIAFSLPAPPSSPSRAGVRRRDPPRRRSPRARRWCREFTPADGSEPIVSEVTKASVLRDVALGEKVALYQGMNKLLNCGGIGNCGTCTLRVTEGAELLSERTDAEKRKLKGKPEDWRMACRCLVGGDEAPEGAVPQGDQARQVEIRDAAPETKPAPGARPATECWPR